MTFVSAASRRHNHVYECLHENQQAELLDGVSTSFASVATYCLMTEDSAAWPSAFHVRMAALPAILAVSAVNRGMRMQNRGGTWPPVCGALCSKPASRSDLSLSDKPTRMTEVRLAHCLLLP